MNRLKVLVVLTGNVYFKGDGIKRCMEAFAQGNILRWPFSEGLNKGQGWTNYGE